MRPLHHALRSLLRTPAFTIASLLTLALGIGATTAIFSLVSAVILAPVPYPEPERLVVLTSPNGASQSGLIFTLARDRIRGIESIAAQSGVTTWNVATRDAAISVRGLRVSTDYLKVHGVHPALGREFSDGEDTPGGPDAALVSDALWNRVFSGRADALGQTITLGGTPHTIVGVLPADFATIPAVDILTPLRTTERDTGVNYRVIGRTRAGITPEAAGAELEAMRTDLLRTIPGLIERRVPHYAWTGYRDVLARGVRQPLLVLLGAVVFLLLIACVNVANLYLARAVARHREIATRASLGASRLQLLTTIVSEALLLAAAGAALGIAVAFVSTRLLLAVVSADLASEWLAGATVTLDGRVLLATIAITVAAGLFFGLAPALTLSRLDIRSALGARTTSGPQTSFLRRVLTVAEVSLAVVLLVGAGLLIRTFAKLTTVDLGFSPDGIVIGRMSLQGTSSETAAARARLFDQALARIRQLPGVAAAAVSNHVPVESGLNLTLLPPDGALIEQGRAMDWRYITPEYFALFSIPLRTGRVFDERDRAGAPPVAIVNEAFARTYFGRLEILGQTIALAPAMKDDARAIVGIVANVKARSNSGFTRGLNALAADTAPAIYVPAAQAPDAAVQIANRFFDTKWIVKTRGPAGAIERDIEAAVRAVDATLPFVRFEPMTAVIGRDLDLQRLMTVLLGAFAAAAMVLASVGLYGLVAYSAVQRRQEVGLRMALGATRADVIRSFLRDGLSTVALGLAIGIAGAALTTRVLSAGLFGVTPLDLTTFIVAASGLVLVAICASLIPAASAARLNPVEVLRDS